MRKDDKMDEAAKAAAEATAREAAEKAEFESGSAISRRFLLGDLTKAVMREIQEIQIPWGALDEKGQQKVIDRVGQHVKEAVRKVVDIIVADGKMAEQVVIESVLFKDGVKLVVQMSKLAEGRHAIADAAGGRALLVLPDADKYMKGDAPKASPDQPDLLGDDPPPAGKGADGSAGVDPKAPDAPDGNAPA